MAENPFNPPGRHRAVALVREFATRPEPKGYPTTRRTPVLIFTGPKGCGKTALLDAVESHLRGKVPYARVNCGALKSSTAWEVLPLLAFDLNRNCAGYRAIPFPRFVTAQVAISAQVDSPGQAARLRVREALENARRVDQLRTFLDELAQDVSGAVPAVTGVPGAVAAARYASKLLLEGLVSWRRGRRVVLGEGLEWYGSGNQAYDELVRLNLLTREDATEADRKEATELLWAAFLADLRAAFAKGRARTWSMNCVLLLDDLDSRPGRLLYRALADARRGEPDPLTAVATSAGGVAWHVAPDEEIPFAEEGSYQDYLERRQGEYESDSYPVALRDLTSDEVRDMVADVAGPRLNARRAVAAEVYRFTRGHPAATAVVVKAVGDSTGDTPPLKRLLAARWRGPVDEEPVTVGERLLRELLGSPTPELLARLETCAAARDVEQADELARSGLVPRQHGGVELVPAELRVRDPGTGRQVMLPALRHLLLRRLAAEPQRWTAAHTWLRDNGRESDRSYHALALRDVDAVVEGLQRRLPDSRAWFAELEAVTTAPNDLDTDESDPARVLAAAGRTGPAQEPGRTTARVVAALWIANDPLSTADRAELYNSAAWDLRTLAQQPGVARNDFLKAAALVETKAEAGDTAVPGRPRRQVTAREQAPPDFTPPVPKRALRRKRVRLVAVAAVLALVVGAAVVVGVNLFTRCGAGVQNRGGECVGVTDGSYVFDDRLAAVQRRILEENRRVEALPHVTVALLTPLLPTDVGSVTWQRVRAQLEGAHVAQLAANEDKREPKVRLLLANPGSAQQEWRAVVDQLVDSAEAQRLVGVIGVGQSTTNAQQTARALSAAGIPMVASVVTATGFHVEPPAQPGEPARYLKGFARVSSTTGNQIAVLSDYLAEQGVSRTMLVYDINEDDLYTGTLYDEFKAAAAAGRLSIAVESRFDTEAALDTQFREIMKDLCGDGAPDTVLYAGRAVLLDDLIDNLRQRGCARERRITLVTGSDASMLRTRPDLRPREDQPDLAVVYTPHVDPDAARRMGITEFDRLTAEFERLGFDTADLADGWGVMMHDAMLATTEAISRSAIGAKPGELPTRQGVRAALERSDRERNQVLGAGGAFTLDATTGNAVGRRLPVIEVSPDGAFHVKAIMPVR
ncbi:DNA polymerase III delta prime subunit [Saccharothrix coeruleofusca]|uniref:hypothetical protein n=1 Tax=Saccharothrix coeruleofusca TaxID=33919 RepID=UPI001AE5D63D|nr:hypothetical protein [Saccharothrix coeruleofusca]MBP2335782.1 DNA polymerase III delta prime subunit [Saccharothrix coeruleofusca]